MAPLWFRFTRRTRDTEKSWMLGYRVFSNQQWQVQNSSRERDTRKLTFPGQQPVWKTINLFPIGFSSVSKKSPAAQPFIWKWVWYEQEKSYLTQLPCERLCTKTRFETELSAPRKWLFLIFWSTETLTTSTRNTFLYILAAFCKNCDIQNTLSFQCCVLWFNIMTPDCLRHRLGEPVVFSKQFVVNWSTDAKQFFLFG